MIETEPISSFFLWRGFELKTKKRPRWPLKKNENQNTRKEKFRVHKDQSSRYLPQEAEPHSASEKLAQLQYSFGSPPLSHKSATPSSPRREPVATTLCRDKTPPLPRLSIPVTVRGSRLD